MMQRFLDVVMMECTYQTNEWGWPLLNVLGRTNLNTSFHASFVFMAGEAQVAALPTCIVVHPLYCCVSPVLLCTPCIVVHPLYCLGRTPCHCRHRCGRGPHELRRWTSPLPLPLLLLPLMLLLLLLLPLPLLLLLLLLLLSSYSCP